MAEAASQAAAPDFEYRRITPRKDSSEAKKFDSPEPAVG
jgi:hypothetical protein